MAGPPTAAKGIEARPPEPRSLLARGFAEGSHGKAIEQALESQLAVTRGLERLLEEKGRELFDTLERFKRQSRLVGQQTALHLVIESPLVEAAPKLLHAVAENLEWDVAFLWILDEGSAEMTCLEAWSNDASPAATEFVSAVRSLSFAREVDLPGAVWATGQPSAILDLSAPSAGPRSPLAAEAGLHSGCAFPITEGKKVRGVVELFSKDWREIEPAYLSELAAFGAQVGGFLELRRAKEALYDRELSIARRVQTSLLPNRFAVPRLELAARMVPAEDVGGDYYDVIPAAGGCWIAMGDVTGHGLDAGLVTLMIQSALAALVRSNPDATPEQVLPWVNDVLYENIRERLENDDHVTLSLMRYRSDGRFQIAGAHEDTIVYDANHRRCEILATEGTWLGVVRDIGSVTRSSERVLRPGDQVWLYTDGLTEARNAKREQFGLQRACAIIERFHDEPVDKIRDRLLGAALEWCSPPEDDISVLGMRYRKA